MTIISHIIIWRTFFIFCLFILGVSFVLYYHWLRWGFGDRGVLLGQIIYTLVVILGLIVMASAITSYV